MEFQASAATAALQHPPKPLDPSTLRQDQDTSSSCTQLYAREVGGGKRKDEAPFLWCVPPVAAPMWIIGPSGPTAKDEPQAQMTPRIFAAWSVKGFENTKLLFKLPRG